MKREVLKKKKFWLVILCALLFAVLNAYLYNVGQSVSATCEQEIARETDPETLYLLGDYYFTVKEVYNIDCARLAFTKALKQGGPFSAWLLHQSGRIDFLQSRYGDAIYKFEQEINLFGEEIPNVYYMLGLTYAFMAMDHGKPEAWIESEKQFKKYLEFDPSSPWAHTDLSWVLYSQEKFSEMEEVTTEGLSSHKFHPWLLNMHGLALMNQGEYLEALSFFEKAEDEAFSLTPEQWGIAYPGNDPRLYEVGLEEFRSAITTNIEIVLEHINIGE